jgi:hypothetical protein
MFVEHQSTSYAKIKRIKSCARAGMLNFQVYNFTVSIVKITGKNRSSTHCKQTFFEDFFLNHNKQKTSA